MATILKKLLPHSRNVFVVILLSFVFRWLTIPLALAIGWGIEATLGPDVRHASWGGVREIIGFYMFAVGVFDPIGVLIISPNIYFFFLGVVTFPYYFATIPLCWLACCLVNRRITLNLPQKSFWFFVFIQSYITIITLFVITINLVSQGRFFALFSINNILVFVGTVIFPLLCWWGIERLRKKYVAGADTQHA